MTGSGSGSGSGSGWTCSIVPADTPFVVNSVTCSMILLIRSSRLPVSCKSMARRSESPVITMVAFVPGVSSTRVTVILLTSKPWSDTMDTSWLIAFVSFVILE